jgi:hypothetical protein
MNDSDYDFLVAAHIAPYKGPRLFSLLQHRLKLVPVEHFPDESIRIEDSH